MMRITISVVLLAAIGSFNVNAIRIRTCETLEIDFIKHQFQNGAFNKENLSNRKFKRGAIGVAEMCQFKDDLISDGLSFTLYKPKGESNNYIHVHNGIDGSFEMYGPFIGNYT